MPLSPAVSDPYSTQPDGEPQPDSIPAEYEALVASLLVLLAAWLAPKPGVPVPEWTQGILWRLPEFRTRVRNQVGWTWRRVIPVAEQAVRDAYARGVREAAQDARWRGPTPDVPPDLVQGLLAALEASHVRVQAVMEETVRRAVYAARDVQGDPTVAVQRVLDEAAQRGITGYVDRAGRRWSLETYVETAVRWRLADAALKGYVGTCLKAGVRFARISVNHSTHKACLVWEGKIISLDGSPRGTYLTHANSGRPVWVECAGSLEESRAAGVWHPWCQHRLTALVPGGGVRARGPASTSRVARAQRRYWARTARAWDRRSMVALTSQAKVRAEQTAKRWRSRRR